MKEAKRAFKILGKLLKVALSPSTTRTKVSESSKALQIPMEFRDQFRHEDIARSAWISDVISKEDVHTLEKLFPTKEALMRIPKAENPLVIAASYNKFNSVKKLLDLGADPNSLGGLNSTPLMEACISNNAAMVLLLLSLSVNVNAKDESGATAMHMAASKANLQIVQALSDHNAMLNEEDEDGLYPLDWLARIEMNQEVKSEARQKLIDLGAKYSPSGPSACLNFGVHPDPGKSGLIESGGKTRALIGPRELSSNSKSGPKNIVQQQEDNAQIGTNHLDNSYLESLLKSKPNALVNVVALGNVENVKVLLALGADPNTFKKKECPPLVSAVLGRHYEIIKLLIQAGADVDIQDSDGSPPLFFALSLDLFGPCTEGQELEAVTLLLEHGANPDLPNKLGFTPRKWAETNGKISLLERAIKKVEKSKAKK